VSVPAATGLRASRLLAADVFRTGTVGLRTRRARAMLEKRKALAFLS